MYGYGYGGLINSMSGGGGVANGALTTAWITATSETDPTIITKWNDVETGVTPFLSKLDCLYGFNTTDATKSKYNFLNAVDSDGAFRITWSGTVTFTTDGAQGTGSTNAGNTHWMPSVNGSLSSFHMSGYAMQDITEIFVLMASAGDNPNYHYNSIHPRYTDGKFYGYLNSNSVFTGTTNSTGIGFYVVNQKSNGDIQLWKDGVLKTTVANSLSGLNNANIQLLANGRPSSNDSFSSNRIKFATIGRELSDSDIVALSTTALNFVS